MEEKESQARALLDKTNRQFNECNALYHAAAQRCGLSDAAFWTLYALVTSCEPLTQNRIAADWGIPKQTLNSAVAAMVKKGLLALCPGKGPHSGKIVTLTDEGRALAERTVGPVIAAEQQAMTRQGLAEVEQNCRLTQRYLECLRQEFEKIAR
ncbi:MarR family winged helix-turn-helix transcriptional regulator [Gemmiger formicilis]